jgi:hypothetical protein
MRSSFALQFDVLHVVTMRDQKALPFFVHTHSVFAISRFDVGELIVAISFRIDDLRLSSCLNLLDSSITSLSETLGLLWRDISDVLNRTANKIRTNSSDKTNVLNSEMIDASAAANSLCRASTFLEQVS